jgi:hypothetical protein
MQRLDSAGHPTSYMRSAGLLFPLFFDDTMGVSEAHPGSVGGGRADDPVEPNDGTMLGRHVSDRGLVHVLVGGRPYAHTIPAAGHLRSDNWGGFGSAISLTSIILHTPSMKKIHPFNEVVSAGAVGGGGAFAAELNDMLTELNDKLTSSRAAGHREDSAAGGGRFPFLVRLMEHLRPTNWGDLQAGAFRSTVSFPSSAPFTVGGGDALQAELNDMLPSPRSTTRARGHGGSESVFVDEMGGRFLVIHINTPQQGNPGVLAAEPGTQVSKHTIEQTK